MKAVLMGVAEGWRVADKIAKAKIPVIVGPILSVPRRDNDRFDAAYTNPGKMAKAGVKVAIRTDNAENTRNLPFNAGFAAAYGMGTEEALKAVTINPAEIFGVANKYGSIDKGKVANIIVSTGDPFETKTVIEKLFIRGWNIPLESRQTLLYDEFLERSPGTKQ
jgi:imidazolonepropionase-like amidohydrolase